MIKNKTENAKVLVTFFKDFSGDVTEWKIAFYELFRYQMTFYYAHEIEASESRANGVFVRLVIKPAFEKNALDLMHDLGFKNINVYDAKVLAVNPYADDTIHFDVETAYIDW